MICSNTQFRYLFVVCFISDIILPSLIFCFVIIVVS